MYVTLHGIFSYNNIMHYYKQHKNYTCGCACFQMVLSRLGFTDIPDQDSLELAMNTSLANTGTHYDDMKRIGVDYDLNVIDGVDGTIDHIDQLTKDGWVVVLGISLDVPHFVVYLDNNGNHIFMDDPFRGQRSNFQIKKFLRNHWDINHKKYTMLKYDFPDLVFDPTMDRHRYWIAYKKKD